jgi:hypothetical protein
MGHRGEWTRAGPTPPSSWARPRIQSHGRRRAWLWILTFVRMTGRGYAAKSSGSIAYSTAALAVAAALSPIASGTIWSR